MTRKIFITSLLLILASIACQTILPKTPSASEIPIAAETITSVTVEAPAPTHTPRPTPHPITCTDDSCLDACLTRINEILETPQLEPPGGAYANTDANLKLVLYTVKNGALSEPDMLYVPGEFKPFQEDLETQQSVWNYASALLPDDQLKLITEYVIFTDGSYNVLAWVNAKNDLDRSHWQLAVDIADAENPIYLTSTLIHEFGHLLSLNSDQITQTQYYYGWDQNPATCQQFTSPEGCSTPNSYINRFYQNFWADIFEEWLEIVEKPNSDSPEEFIALVDDFYSFHRNQFVRKYAATNIREDIAESFMHFVMDPKPAGDNVIEKKILFFYEFPELVALRKQIIQNVCSYTQE